MRSCYRRSQNQKEVNFSDTYLRDDGIYRIPGTNRGKKFSSVNAHDWFSYEMKLRPNPYNTLIVVAEGTDSYIDFKLTVGDESIEISQKQKGINEFDFCETEGKDSIRIRLDRISSSTPDFYELKIK